MSLSTRLPEVNTVEIPTNPGGIPPTLSGALFQNNAPGSFSPTAITGGVVNPILGVNRPFANYPNDTASLFPQFKGPSMLTNPTAARQAYDTDTSHAGMLASFYGPTMRYAQSVSLRDIYAAESGQTLSFGFGEGSGIGVNAMIDWSLPAKQSDPGHIMYYRKLADDLRPMNVEAFYQGLNAGRVNPIEVPRGVTSDPIFTNWSHDRNQPVGAPARTYSAAELSQPTVFRVPGVGFAPNINTFGYGWGVQTFNPTDRITYTATGGSAITSARTFITAAGYQAPTGNVNAAAISSIYGW